jgi:hypothetical protein
VFPCIVMLKEDFSNIFMRSDSPEMLLQGIKSLNVQIWVNGLTTWHSVYQNHLFCIPRTMGRTFSVEELALNIFFQVGLCHSIDFLSGVQSDRSMFHPQ